MTLDEQRKVKAESLLRLDEKQEELRCCHLKAQNMKECWNVLGQVLTGHMQGYTPTKELADYPSPEDVQALLDDITRLTTEIAGLERLLNRSGSSTISSTKIDT